MFLSASPKYFVCIKQIRKTILRKKDKAVQKENAHICLLHVDVPQILNIKTINNILGNKQRLQIRVSIKVLKNSSLILGHTTVRQKLPAPQILEIFK